MTTIMTKRQKIKELEQKLIIQISRKNELWDEIKELKAEIFKYETEIADNTYYAEINMELKEQITKLKKQIQMFQLHDCNDKLREIEKLKIERLNNWVGK